MNINYFSVGPSTSGVFQNDAFSISTIGFPSTNTLLLPLQIRNSQFSIQNLFGVENSPFSSRSSFPMLFDTPRIVSNPFLEAERLVSQMSISPLQIRPEPITSLFSRPGYISQRTLEARLLSLLELERRAFQTFEILFDNGIFEGGKQEPGLNKEQIDKIEVSEFEDKLKEKEPVARIKSRNGIYKTAKPDPKKVIKASLRKEKSEPTSSSTCAICLEDYKDKEKLRKFPCSHKFHLECIDQWLTLKNNCPVCKGKPVEEPPINSPRIENASNQPENNDLLQLLTLSRPTGSGSITHTNSSVPHLTGLITDMYGFNRMRNTAPIIIDDSSDSPNTSNVSNKQARRTEIARNITTENHRGRNNKKKLGK